MVGEVSPKKPKKALPESRNVQRDLISLSGLYFGDETLSHIDSLKLGLVAAAKIRAVNFSRGQEVSARTQRLAAGMTRRTKITPNFLFLSCSRLQQLLRPRPIFSSG